MNIEQTEMWDGLNCPAITPPGEDNSLQARFEKFNAGNPKVYELLVAMAKAIRGRRPNAIIGIAMLYEVLRWNCYMYTDSDEPYKLSNDFKAFYARKIMDQNEDLVGIFVTKKSVADELEAA